MALLWNWYWSTEKTGATETNDAHRKLFTEMKELFEIQNTTNNAERKYDYFPIYRLFCADLDAVNALYENVDCIDGKVFYPTVEAKVKLGRAIEKYLDDVVTNKEFVFDNQKLKLAVAKKLLEYPLKEGFLFDWHYWQLFRRHLSDDMYKPTIALDIIEHGVTDDDEDDDESQ